MTVTDEYTENEKNDYQNSWKPMLKNGLKMKAYKSVL